LLAADLGGSWQEPESSALTIETEPDGSFEAWLPGGTWRAFFFRFPGAGVAHVPTPAAASVVAGERTQVTFRIMTGTRPVRVLDRAGRPVSGVHLELHADLRGGRRSFSGGPPTDVEGRSLLVGDPGPYSVTALRPGLETLPAQQDHLAAGGSHDDLRVAVGRIELAPGEPAEIVLRLPLDWGR